MRIKMHTLAAGPEHTFHPGKEYIVDDAFGQPLVEGGYAIRLDVPKPQPVRQAEDMVIPPPKVERLRRGRPKR